MIELNRCDEEEWRLSQERCAMQEWMLEEWKAVTCAIGKCGKFNVRKNYTID